MTPTLDLSRDVARQCSKPRCSRDHIHRHHKGCEAMWLRHFAYKRQRPAFIKFAARYREFHPQDVTAVCSWHHEEVHVLYLSIINKHIERNKLPLWAWSWSQANALMAELRAFCEAWLLRETPGLRPVKFAQPLGVSQ